MPKYNVKVEVHKYQDLSDRPVERMLPIEASDEEDAFYRMRDLINEERRKDAEASGVSEPYGVALYVGKKNESKRYVGRVLDMGHAKLVRESTRTTSERRATAIEDEAARSRSPRVTAAGSWGGGYK